MINSYIDYIICLYNNSFYISFQFVENFVKCLNCIGILSLVYMHNLHPGANLLPGAKLHPGVNLHPLM